MNKRFIWNFEIDAHTSLQIPSMENFIKTPHRWEARFFWPIDQPIILHGLNNDFLKLSNYQIKHRADSYYLLPNNDYNLKIRNDELYYKPVLMKKPNAIAYGKKIKLEEDTITLQLPNIETENISALINHIYRQGKKVCVEKEALVYEFDVFPSIKLELALLFVANQSYLSASIESRSFTMVESIASQLIGNYPSSDYVTFLKENVT